MGAADDHYFSAHPGSVSRPRRVTVRARGLTVPLTTDSGTFSPGRIDAGTAFLLDKAPDPPETGRFVDVGCGYGPMACTLASLSPDASVVAVDVNERSRSLCRENASALGLDNVIVAGPDDVDPTDRYDLIWSNPPIRVGKDALHDVLLRWLGRLTDSGSAVLVVNRHLGADSLQRWLTDAGYPTERLASKKGYRLLEARPTDGV